MAFFDTAWYINFGNGSTTGYYAVATRPQNTAVVAGQLCRQFTAPAVGSERVFVCIVAGTTANVTDATWVLTRGAKTTDGTATWQECTGATAVNGDLTNTRTWSQARAISTAVTLGAIIQRNSGGSYQICSTAGSSGASEPAGFSNTAGVTTADSTVTWTSLGLVGNFGAWAAPHARLPNSFANTWGAAGHIFFVGDNHAETSAAAIVVSCPQTAALPGRVLSIDHTLSVPPAPGSLKAGASITSTLNAASALSIQTNTFTGAVYFYGITFATSAVTAGCLLVGQANQSKVRFEQCSFQLTANSGTPTINLGAASTSGGNSIELIDSNFSFANVNQSIQLTGSHVYWRNQAGVPGLIGTGAGFAGLFQCGAVVNSVNVLFVEGVDLSPAALYLTGSVGNLTACFKLCYLNGSTIAVLPNANGSSILVDLVECSDSLSSNNRNERWANNGAQLSQVPSISLNPVRTGGASDVAPYSFQISVPSANYVTWATPFNAIPITIWNSTVGTPVTITVHAIFSGTPTNASMWIDVEYLGSASSNLGSFATNGQTDILAAPTAYVSDGASAWDSGIASRLNSHLYNPGNTITVASNPGRVFFCTVSSGLTASSEPVAFASAVDGTVVTDGSATFVAGFRVAMSVTVTPQQAGYITVYPRFGSVQSNLTYFDPLIILS